MNRVWISHKLNPATGLYDRRWWFKRLPMWARLGIIKFQHPNDHPIIYGNIAIPEAAGPREPNRYDLELGMDATIKRGGGDPQSNLLGQPYRSTPPTVKGKACGKGNWNG